MNINNLEIRHTDNNLLGKKFGKLTIIEPNKYYDITDNNSTCYVKCKCDCGNELFVIYNSLISKRSKTCYHCYDNKYIIYDEYVSLLYIYDFKITDYRPVFINTECVDYLKSLNYSFRIHYDSKINGRLDVTTSTKCNKIQSPFLSRIIVSYINSKYNLPPLTDDLQIDHINGDTLNNLYYPFDDYYNNLRACTPRQNYLNKRCNGYTITKQTCPLSPYRASIVNKFGNRMYKQCKSPQECINYNISQLSDIDKQYYYHSPSNPRNNPNTFSNTILNAIGYNDNEYEYTDDDFNDDEFEKYI